MEITDIHKDVQVSIYYNVWQRCLYVFLLQFLQEHPFDLNSEQLSTSADLPNLLPFDVNKSAVDDVKAILHGSSQVQGLLCVYLSKLCLSHLMILIQITLYSYLFVLENMFADVSLRWWKHEWVIKWIWMRESFVTFFWMDNLDMLHHNPVNTTIS